MIKSTNHRVIAPPPKPEDLEDTDDPNAVFPARYSVSISLFIFECFLTVFQIPFFCNPNFEKVIEALPGTFDSEITKKYPPVNSGDYLEMRLAATY